MGEEDRNCSGTRQSRGKGIGKTGVPYWAGNSNLNCRKIEEGREIARACEALRGGGGGAEGIC